MAHVLLVEDNAPLRQLLAEFLEAAGHQLESVSDGAEALARLRQHRPDAVVLDLQLPAVDGWTILRACRATSGLADLPVVVMSALEDAGTTVAGLGVRCCLSKLSDLDQLAASSNQPGFGYPRGPRIAVSRRFGCQFGCQTVWRVTECGPWVRP